MKLTALLLLAVLLGAAPSARAADSPKDANWQVAISAYLSLSGHNTRSGVASNLRPSPPPPPAPQLGGGQTLPSLGETFLREQTIFLPSVAGSIEIASPVLFNGYGTPRVFVHADFLPVFSPDLKLAGEGSPGAFKIPNQVAAPEEAIGGQGSRTTWDPATLAFGAGLGMSFQFEIFDVPFAIKPSAEWYSYQGTFRTFVSRALKRQQQTTIDRLIQVRLTERRTFHAVGGGLELEVEMYQSGDFSTQFFVLGRGYSLVGDRSITGSFFQAAAPNPDRVSSFYTASPYLYNFGIGFRVRWLGM